MAVVAIDTASSVVGVALASEREVWVRTEAIARGTEAVLLPFLEQMLAQAGLSRAQISGVAVSRGPGAFTGIRVGLATATGLASALGVPVWAVSSLRARAWRLREHAHALVMLDAKKDRVYAQRAHHGQLVGDPADVAPEVALAWMAQAPFVAMGEGALTYAAQVQASGGGVVDEPADPCVAELAQLGRDALLSGEGVDPLEVSPRYFRPADAKLPQPRPEKTR